MSESTESEGERETFRTRALVRTHETRKKGRVTEQEEERKSGRMRKRGRESTMEYDIEGEEISQGKTKERRLEWKRVR